MLGFIAPNRGVRYQLKEHSRRPPTNPKELFNLMHSMLCSWVEQAFAILKNRLKILTSNSITTGANLNDQILTDRNTQHKEQHATL